MDNVNNHICIMKIASGSMDGQELLLTIDKHLIIIDPTVKYRTEIDDTGFITYYIPSHSTYCKLTITVNNNALLTDDNPKKESTLNLQVNDGINTTYIPIVFQKIMLANLFPVAFKKVDMLWELNDLELNPKNTYNTKSKTASFTPKKKIITVIISIFIFIFFFIVIKITDQDNKSEKLEKVSHILNGKHSPIITLDNNESPLILIKTKKEADWIKQTLYRSGYKEKYTIRILHDLENQLENEIALYISNIIKIDLSNPCKPIIKIIFDNRSSINQKIINNIISRHLNDFQNSEIIQITLDDLLKKVEVGLIDSILKWKKINKDNTIIYLIQGHLNDHQLISISNFAQQFYNQWGEKYIRFSISLLENKLEGKSFIQNQNDFILIDNNHWSFISNKTH